MTTAEQSDQGRADAETKTFETSYPTYGWPAAHSHSDVNAYVEGITYPTSVASLKRDLNSIRHKLQRIAKQAEGVTLGVVGRERINDELVGIRDLLDDLQNITSP